MQKNILKFLGSTVRLHAGKVLAPPRRLLKMDTN